jgi:MFS family permease
VLQYLGFNALSLLIVWELLLQAATDYPTGVISDWIGQRWVLFIAYTCYTCTFLMLTISKTFPEFFIVYSLSAIGNAQMSGALDSWFDNNYKVSAGEVDPERKVYMVVCGKLGTILSIVSGVTIVSGGIVADISQREIVFIIQALACAVISIICLLYVDDLQGVKEKGRKSMKVFISLFGRGFSVIFKERILFYTVIANVAISTAILTWNELLLFPFYFSYTKSDSITGVLRFILWIMNAFWFTKAATWGSKLDTRRWLPRFAVITFSFFFTGLIIITVFFPMSANHVSVEAIIVLVAFYFVYVFFATCYTLLTKRIFVEIVPNDNRNSVYSLLPTLTILVSVPFIFLIGIIVEIATFQLALLILLIISISGGFLYFLAFNEDYPANHQHNRAD